MDKMLMHLPYPFPQELIGGSRARLYQMYRAFPELGCGVELIAGNVSVKGKNLEQVYRRSTTVVIPSFRFHGVGDRLQGEDA